MSDNRIVLALDGPAISDTYPLGQVSLLLGGFSGILEESSAVVARKLRLRRATVPRLNIRAAFPRRGSYVIDLQLAADAVRSIATWASPAAIILSQITPAEVFANAKAAIDLLRYLMKLRSENKEIREVSVSAPDNHGTIVVADHFHLTVNAVETASRSEQNFIATALALSNKEISHLTAAVPDQAKIEITCGDGELVQQLQAQFGNRVVRESLKELAAKIDDGKTRRIGQYKTQPFSVDGSLIAFDKEERVGTFRVSTGQRVPAGDYRLIVEGDQGVEGYIFAMAEGLTKLLCVAEYVGKSRKPKVLRALTLNLHRGAVAGGPAL